VVSVLATEHKSRGFKHGGGDELLSFGWELKPEAPCKILRHVKDPLRYFRY
jgi:hypothetical protein